MRGSSFRRLIAQRRNAACRSLSDLVAAAGLLAIAWSGAQAAPGDLWEEPGSFAADPQWSVDGVWRDAVELPDTPGSNLFGVHAALLHDGTKAKLVFFRNELLLFDLSPGGATSFLDLDGTTADPVWTPNDHEPFCSGYVGVDNRLFIYGNDLWHVSTLSSVHIPVTTTWASLFDPEPVITDARPTTANWIDAGPVPQNSGSDNPNCAGVEWSLARYYPTCTLLPDGRVLMAAGDFWTDCNGDHEVQTSAAEYDVQERWLIYDPSTGTWEVDIDPGGFNNPWNQAMVSYPHMKVLPHGLFWHGNDGTSTGSDIASRLWTPFETWGDPSPPAPLQHVKNHNHLQGSCVVLTLDARSTDASVLMVGGGPVGSTAKQSQGAEIITYRRDPNTGQVSAVTPGWTYTGAMQSDKGRRHGNAVLLPTGEVMAIGGSEVDTDPAEQNLSCEIFAPGTLTWRTVDSLARERGHHSTALLLPDGRVVSTGWEQDPNIDNSYQIYYPPYLFSGGDWATRPSITSAPAVVSYGLPFEIGVSGLAADIDSVVLMRPGAPTHGADFTQGRVLLSHTTNPTTPAEDLLVSGPKDSLYAPPGNYMLMVLDGGVPSVAQWVRVERGGSYVIPGGSTVTWGADVWLGQGFTVSPGATLRILPGTTVHADAEATSGVFVLVQGQMLAEGTPSQPIVFTSTDGTGAPGEWYGIRFELTGCMRPSYGYAVCAQPTSALESVVIENAQVGVAIENLCAPRLADVEFVNITGDRHIYLDGSDACLPAGYWATGDCGSPGTFQASAGTWDLRPGTNVVAKNGAPAPGKDAWVANLGKVDLIAFAQMTAEGTETDSIHFRPETPDVGNGDGWGTLYLGYESEGSSLRFVDIGYSQQPLYAYYPQSLTIGRSRIHHFGDTGLSIHGTGSLGAVVDSCVIERGSGLAPTRGLRGVLLSSTSELRFQENRVDLSGLQLSPVNSAAMEVVYTKVFCQTSAADSLVIRRTELIGPGTGTTTDHQGIRSVWVCGTALRKILYDENYIHDFRQAGLEFHQCADLQVNCNTVFDNLRAVDFYRDSEPDGPGVRFRSNWLEVNVGVEQAVRTDDNLKTKLGRANGLPLGESVAGNALAVRNEEVNWIETMDLLSDDDLPAEANFWFLSSGSNWAQQIYRDDVTHEPWALKIVPYSVSNPIVDYDPWGGLVYNPPYCHAEEWPWPPSRMVASPGESQLGEDAPRTPGADTAVVDQVASLPRANDLRAVSPRGGREPVMLELAVAPGKEGRYVIEVFDVSGRRVTTLLDGLRGAGVHRLAWSGRDDATSAASGVYFARVTGPSWTVIRKVIVVR